MFDSGEQNAEPLLPYYLQEYHGLSATMRLAKRYGGVAILWEHRFYGDSLPFPVNVCFCSLRTYVLDNSPLRRKTLQPSNGNS